HHRDATGPGMWRGSGTNRASRPGRWGRAGPPPAGTRSRRTRTRRPCGGRRTPGPPSNPPPPSTSDRGRGPGRAPLPPIPGAGGEVGGAGEEAHARELVLGPAHQVVAPGGRERAVVPRGEHRVLVEPLLPAGQGAAVLLAPHLPAAGVPAEEGDVPPPGDERL